MKVLYTNLNTTLTHTYIHISTYKTQAHTYTHTYKTHPRLPSMRLLNPSIREWAELLRPREGLYLL